MSLDVRGRAARLHMPHRAGVTEGQTLPVANFSLLRVCLGDYTSHLVLIDKRPIHVDRARGMREFS
jgi:hypothetical protein